MPADSYRRIVASSVPSDREAYVYSDLRKETFYNTASEIDDTPHTSPIGRRAPRSRHDHYGARPCARLLPFRRYVILTQDLTRTTAALFFTRWITHFCAPVFMFTAGLGAFFWLSRGRSKGELSVFLWKRGVWLILLDLIVIRFAMTFSLV